MCEQDWILFIRNISLYFSIIYEMDNFCNLRRWLFLIMEFIR